MADIRSLLFPDSIAVVGASPLVQSVQRGLETGAITQGRQMGESEKLIADFQRRVHAALTAPA